MKKWSGLLSILVLLLISGILIQFASADRATLEKVRQAIKEKGAKWDAGETSVSILPDEQFKMMLGAIFPDEPPKGAKTSVIGAKATVSLDWRNNNGGNYVTSVKNQGGCGSCWAFGTIASAESLNMIVNNTPVVKVKKQVTETDLSEQELVSCLYGISPTGDRGKCDGCGGCDPYWAYDYLMSDGVPIEGCFPYTASNSECAPACSTGTVQINGWSPVSQDVDSLEYVVSQHPIPVGFQVYQDFQYYRSGVYQHVSGVRVGGHIVCLVGWNNSPLPEGKGKNKFTPPPYFICKNSWGTGWGESGFFRIAQTEIDNDIDFGARAADFSLGNLAPPKLAKPTAMVTLWGSIKRSY